MSFFGRISLVVMVSAALAAATGCSPGDSGQADDEKEPHYVLGNSRYNEMDWPGAIEAFQESLEVNPHSAAAHFRLAELFDTKYPDPAAAIYHYEQYLKLEPDAKNRDVINARIHSCKVLLASDECGLPDSPAVQRQMESLAAQNHQLQGQVDKLTEELRQWSAYYASLKAAGIAGNPGGNNNPSGPAAAPAAGLSDAPDDISKPVSSGNSTPVTGGASGVSPAAAPARDEGVAGVQPGEGGAARKAATHTGRSHTHVVLSGETLAAIARKHGLSLSALEEANPGVNPKKLRVGETILLPP